MSCSSPYDKAHQRFCITLNHLIFTRSLFLNVTLVDVLKKLKLVSCAFLKLFREPMHPFSDNKDPAMCVCVCACARACMRVCVCMYKKNCWFYNNDCKPIHPDLVFIFCKRSVALKDPV